MRRDLFEMAICFLLGAIVLGGWVAIGEWAAR